MAVTINEGCSKTFLTVFSSEKTPVIFSEKEKYGKGIKEKQVDDKTK